MLKKTITVAASLAAIPALSAENAEVTTDLLIDAGVQEIQENGSFDVSVLNIEGLTESAAEEGLSLRVINLGQNPGTLNVILEEKKHEPLEWPVVDSTPGSSSLNSPLNATCFKYNPGGVASPVSSLNSLLKVTCFN